MAEVIASTYEILRELGSGGGGTVYLANHLRLNKQVALKADKRRISTKPALLRREVDVLKDLSHPYIPQVYDFFVEDGTVYTAIDFISGESMDKALKRGERFPQPLIVKWMIELLEALQYLHSPIHGDPPRGFVHSDVKPANIMLKSNGDICLIDFNISLAIGEQAVIGASAGYASPEHYGLDYSSHGGMTGMNSDTVAEGSFSMNAGSTSRLTATATVGTDPVSRSAPTAPAGFRVILPDVRSDMYSVGATMYHLLSGKRPAKDARDVVPLTANDCSLQLAEIVNRAMSPDPDIRYQSADDMIRDLRNLHPNDPRAKRRRKLLTGSAAVLAAVFLTGGFLAFTGMKREERLSNDYVLAANSDSALAAGDVSRAVSLAMEALPENRGWFDPPYAAAAQLALTNALKVYDLSDSFKAYATVELPSSPLKAALSPDGTRLAAIIAWQLEIYDTESGEKLASLPVEASALSDVLFLNEDRVVYAADGGIRAWDIAAGRELWSGEPATKLALSADGRRVAAVYKDEGRAVVYETENGRVYRDVSFGGKKQRIPLNDTMADPRDALLALNAGGTLLAASFDDGSLTLYDLERNGSEDLLGVTDYIHFEGGFHDKYLAAAASPQSGNSIFLLFDAQQRKRLGSMDSATPFLTRPDESGIYIADKYALVSFDPVSYEQTPLTYVEDSITGFCHTARYNMVAMGQTFGIFDNWDFRLQSEEIGTSCDFLALAGDMALIGSNGSVSLRLLKLESHSDADLLAYDPTYSHMETRWSADRETVMFFGRSRFRIADMDGDVVADVEIPDTESLYDEQFRREGDDAWLEVTYLDGLVRRYSAWDGSLLSETQGDAPDASGDQELLTESWRVTKPAHGAREVYDRGSGRRIGELAADDYLTYVTEVDGQLIAQYLTSEGECYGILFDAELNELARMPDLRDVLPDGTLLFDDGSGTVRGSHIYSLDELRALAAESGAA